MENGIIGVILVSFMCAVALLFLHCLVVGMCLRCYKKYIDAVFIVIHLAINTTLVFVAVKYGVVIGEMGIFPICISIITVVIILLPQKCVDTRNQ